MPLEASPLVTTLRPTKRFARSMKLEVTNVFQLVGLHKSIQSCSDMAFYRAEESQTAETSLI